MTIDFNKILADIPAKTTRAAVSDKALVKEGNNSYAFDFGAVFHPTAGDAWHGLGDVLPEAPKDGLDMLQRLGLDDEHFKINVRPRYMEDLSNPGNFLPTNGHHVIAQWGEKQFELNPNVSANFSKFSWEDALIPNEDIANGLIPWGLVAFDNGARVAAQYLVGDIGEGGILDGVAFLLTIMGSLDGSTALSTKSTKTRIVCANTFHHVKMERSDLVRRLKRHASASAILPQWKESYAAAVQEAEAFKKVVNKLKKKKLTDSDKNEFYAILFGKNGKLDDLTERQQKMVENNVIAFNEHLNVGQPGADELDPTRAYAWVQATASWALREKRVAIHGSIGNNDEEVVKKRMRFDSILSNETGSDAPMQYLYNLVA